MSATIYEPTIRVKVDGKEVPVVAITLVSAINAYPEVEIVTFQTNSSKKQVQQVATTTVMKEMEKQQKKLFTVRQKPDVIVYVALKAKNGSDPIKGDKTIKMKCYTTSVRMSYSANGAYKTITAIAEYAVMDGINMGIYMPQSGSSQDTAANATGNIPFEGDILEFTKQFINKRMKKKNIPEMYNVGTETVKNPSIKALEKQHTLNLKLKKYFIQILTSSKETFGWKKLPSALKQTDSNGKKIYPPQLPSHIVDCLSYAGGSFLQAMVLFADSFQCFYRPMWDKAGYITNWKEAKKHSKTFGVYPVAINVSAGYGKLFPPKYVIVGSDGISSSVEGVRPSTQDKAVPLSFAYPEKNIVAGATCTTVMKPKWMGGISIYTIDPKEGKTSDDKVDVKAVLKKDNEAVKKAKQALEKNVKSYKDLLEEYASCVYNKVALEGSTVRLKLPLVLGLRVGLYYKIKSGDGTLFSGLLTSIQHEITLGEGNSTAGTEAVFSRVCVRNFKLPGDK